MVDPLAEMYYSSTPYNYVDNNPIVRIDLNGTDWIVSANKDKEKFPNGNDVPTAMQQFKSHNNNPYYEANFMNYTGRADYNTLHPNVDAKRFFMNTVGNATRGQIRTIINNLYNGNLN